MAKKITTYPLIIVIFGILAYANTFQVPFGLDDLTSITLNPVITDLANYLPGGSGYDFIPRRWVGYLTFALNYHLGELDVTGYHIFNLTVHLSAALLVYILVKLTFRTPQLSGSRLVVHSRTVALLAALFFVVHPLQTQAVTYVVQRLTSLATLFYLLSIVCYVVARLKIDETPTQNKTNSEKDLWPIFLLFTGAVTTAILGMQTKEIAFTLPFAVILYEFSFFRGAWKRRTLYLLPLLLTLPIIPLGIFAASGADSVDNGLAGVDEQLRAQTDIPRLHYFFTQFRVLITYLRLLILPIRQNLDYDYPVFTTIFTPPVLLSFLLLVAMIGLAVYLHLRSRQPQAPALASVLSRDPALRLISFGIFWFFLALSVESSLIPIFDVIFEHRLYLPSVGIFVAFATLLLLASEKTATILRGRIPLLAAVLMIIALTVVTFQRNDVWGNNVRLWEDVVRKSPNKARPWYNYGCYLSDVGRAEEAIQALSRAIQIDPQHADAWHNLGRAYLMSGRNADAVRPLRQAVRIMPDLDNAVVNLAVALIHVGQTAEAVVHLERIRQRAPNWPEVRLNLGIAYIGVGNLVAAKGELSALYRLAPDLTPPLATRIEQAAAKAHPQ